MKVIRSNERKEVDFSSLKPGDCFEKWDILYVKSEANQQATGLKNGEACVNMCGVYVTPVNAEVHIID